MNTDYIKAIAMDVVKSVVSVKLANSLDLAHKLNFGNSAMLKGLSDGTIYASCSDLINYFTKVSLLKF